LCFKSQSVMVIFVCCFRYFFSTKSKARSKNLYLLILFNCLYLPSNLKCILYYILYFLIKKTFLTYINKCLLVLYIIFYHFSFTEKKNNNFHQLVDHHTTFFFYQKVSWNFVSSVLIFFLKNEKGRRSMLPRLGAKWRMKWLSIAHPHNY